MSKNLERKKQVVAEIREKLDRAQVVILVDYMGINVEQDTELRRKCREAGVEYKIYKNNLFNLATEGTDYSQINKDLVGPNAMLIGYDDPAAAAKVIKNASKEIEALEIKSGVVEGTYFGADGINQLADIPSREELIAKLLGTIGPENMVGRLVRTINKPVSDFTYLLSNIAKEKEAS